MPELKGNNVYTVHGGPFDGGGDGGDDGGMEHRLTEVEKAIIRIDGRFELAVARLDTIHDKLNDVSSRVTNFKWQIFAAAIAVLLAAGAMLFTVQQMTVATFTAAQQTAEKTAAPPQAPQPTIIVVPSPAQSAAPAHTK